MWRITKLWMRLPLIGKMAIVLGIVTAVVVILDAIISQRWMLAEIPYS